MIKRIFKIKRYFIVSYNFQSDKGNGFGCFAFENKNGKFPNRNEMERFLGFKNLAPISILEVCKKDYIDYIKN